MRQTRLAREVATMLALVLAILGQLSMVRADAGPEPTAGGRLMLVMDSSGSMKQKLPGGAGTKIKAAKTALNALVDRLPDTQPVGLRVYGATVFSRHDAGACSDTQRVVDIGTGNRAALRSAIERYQPYGETPIGAALQQAGRDLGGSGQRTIVLVSDGEPTCAPSPCPVARQLAGDGISLKIEVVGLHVSGRARSILSCIAAQGRGRYYDADNAADLAGALDQVATRALRPYKSTGTPIRGTTSTGGAPVLPVGDSLDVLGGLRSRRGQLYYTLRRTIPGSTFHVSASLITGEREDAVSVDVVNGSFQCGYDEEFRNDDSGPVVSASVTVPHDDDSPAFRVDTSAHCVQPKTLTLVVKHGMIGYASGFGARVSSPVEIRVTEEPPVTNLSALPRRLPDPPYGQPAFAARPAKIVGSSSFADATDITPGSYAGTIVPGEVQIFAVPLDWGRYLTDTVKVKPLSARLHAEQGPVWRNLSVRVFSPSRHRAEMPLSHFVGGVTQYGATDYTWTNRVTYRERFDGLQSRRAFERGTYYVAVCLQADGSRHYVVPFTMAVAVRGAVQGAPVYAISSSSRSTPASSATPPVPSPTEQSPESSTTATPPPAPAPTRAAGGRRTWGLVLAGLGGAGVVAGATLYALYRRRRR